MRTRNVLLAALWTLAAAAVQAQTPCNPLTSPFGTGTASCAATATPALSPQAALGKLMFNDAALSASGRQSCASCHAPAVGFTAPDDGPVPRGGAALDQVGPRNAPSAAYASFAPAFNLPASGTLAPNGTPQPPRGGQMRDGRFSSLAIQAQKPFTSSFEMANTDASQVVQRLRTRPYLNQFTATYGAATLNNPDRALTAIGAAIAAYESEGVEFHPFTSKYDAVLSGKASLTAREAAGLAAFRDNTRGHCDSCHTANPAPANAGAAAGKPLFTDFSFHNLGLPRNWAIPFNNDNVPLPGYIPANGAVLGATHKYYDLGLCGPFRADLTGNTPLCGAFKVPSLRNSALKRTYFHNGIFNNLSDVVSFYATRNRTPARWYKKADGTADELYNDLPAAYRANVAPTDRAGALIAPNLSATDIANVVAFLCTLNDGYDPANPLGYNATGQCKGAGLP